MELRSYLTDCNKKNLPVQLVVHAKSPTFIQGKLHSIDEERIIIANEKIKHEVLLADILGYPQQDL